MKIGVIPARFASTRLPAKPLLDLEGKTMIQRVYERCILAQKLDLVVVATDDARIYEHVKSFGGKVEMTASEHNSGTDRLCEVMEKYPEASFFINIQGDEPLISPELIDEMLSLLETGGKAIVTPVRAIKNREDIENPSVVKVVKSQSNRALYFSRFAIPYQRNLSAETVFWQHIGLYGFRREALAKIATLATHALEVAESLEQLRWLGNDLEIYVCETEYESHAVDTPEDAEKIRAILKGLQS